MFRRLALALITAAFVAHAAWLSCVAEDAFISFRFARHLAEGRGLVWNLAEGPVEGYTNFLWVAISALILRLGAELERASQILGVLAGALTIVVSWRFGRDLLRLSPGAALLPCALLAAAGPLACWSASGMETALFGLLLLTGTWLAGRWMQRGARSDLAIGFATLLLATLTRPEGALVFGLTLGLAVAAGWERSGHFPREVAGLSLVYLLPGLAYFLWRLWYFGYLLPNTFYVKTGQSLDQVVRGARYTLYFAAFFLLPVAWLPAAALWRRWLGGPRGTPGARSPRTPEARPEVSWGLGICLGMAGVYTTYIVSVGGDYMAMSRFFVPILPFFYLPAGVAADRLLPYLEPRGRRLAGGLLALSLAALLFPSTPWEARLFPRPWFTHGNYRGVQTERWHTTRYRVIGEFFRRHATSPDESLASTAIGVVAYVSGLQVFDIYGLTDTYIAHHARAGEPLGQGFAGHEKENLPYVLSKKPTFIIFSKSLRPAPAGMPAYPSKVLEVVERDYALVSIRLEDAASGEAGYFTFLERKDRTGTVEEALPAVMSVGGA